MDEIQDVNLDTQNEEQDELDIFIGEEEDNQQDIDQLRAELEKSKEANKRLYARLKKEEVKPKEVKSESNEGLREEITRVRLEAKGFSDDEQDLILKASKALGIEPIKAAAEDFIAAKIEKMREEAKLQEAIPAPSGKASGQGKKSPQWYIDNDEIPQDPEMFYKVTELLKKRK